MSDIETAHVGDRVEIKHHPNSEHVGMVGTVLSPEEPFLYKVRMDSGAVIHVNMNAISNLTERHMAMEYFAQHQQLQRMVERVGHGQSFFNHYCDICGADISDNWKHAAWHIKIGDTA